MKEILNLLDRLGFQAVREYLLHGDHTGQANEKSYEARIQKARKPLIGLIRKNVSDFQEMEKTLAMIYHYANTIQDIYMEIGMQCGAAISLSLLTQTEKESQQPGQREVNEFLQ